MIKIFRTVRQKLLSESKFSQYLIYAIGEIVLVVIGILIALQINNWNAEQKIAKEEMGILNNLLESLHSAKEQSDIEIFNENRLKESLLVALGHNSKKSKLGANTIPDSLFYHILWSSNPNLPVLSSYSDIKNTGKIGIIKNRNIRENFANLELTLAGLTSVVEDRLIVQQTRIDDILVNDVNFVRLLKEMDPAINIDNELQNDYNLILSNQKTRNLLALKLSLTYSVILQRQELGEEIDDLMQVVEVELEREQ